MAELPDVSRFNNSDVTEAQYKQAFSALLDFLKKLAEDVAASQGGVYSFKTISDFEANKATVPENSVVKITTGDEAGEYNWDGTTLSKSEYDPIAQSKDYSDQLFNKLKNLLNFINVNQHDLNSGEKIYFSIQDKVTKALFSIGSKTINWGLSELRLTKGPNLIQLNDNLGRTLLSLSRNGITFGVSKLLTSRDYKILDKFGRASFFLNSSGAVFIPNLTVQSIKKIGEFGQTTEIDLNIEIPKLGYHTYPKRIGIISSGQSLNMGGADTSYQVSTTQPFNNVMFDQGAYKQSQDLSYVPTSFVPLVGNYLSLEFPVLNGCNSLSRQIDKSIDLNPLDYSIWGQVIGEGGQTVEYLTEHYIPKLKKAVDNFKYLCDKNGESGEIWALLWIQGESNSSVAPKGWSAKVLQYQSEAIDHILKTTGQTAIPYVYIYQFASFFHFSPEFGYQTAQQEWLMSKSVDNVVCFTPMYIFDYVDNLHLTPENYWFMGEYIGRAIHHTQFANQGKFRPVEPVDVVWTDNYIDIVFRAPKYPLRFTTDVCTQAINQGFCFYKNKQYQSGLISSVELKDYRTVRINLTAPITDPDFEICYARGMTGVDSGSGRTTGARGNLADSTIESVTSPTNVTRIISHHSVAFTYHKTNGFVV